MFNKIQTWYKIVLLASVVMAFAAAFVVWSVAPEVGGAWWPYIRAVVSFVVGAFVGKATLIVGGLIMSYKTTKGLMERGTENEPWNDEEMENFFESFHDDE